MRAALRLFFGQSSSKPDLRRGITIAVGNRPALLHGELEILIRDERAHKYAMHLKEATGIKVCMLCSNVVEPHSNLLKDPSGFWVSACCLDVGNFRHCTHLELQGPQARLREIAQTGAKAQLEKTEILCGYIYNPSSLLHCASLNIDVSKVVAWDWMRCYIVGGLFQREVSEFAQRLKYLKMGVGPNEIHGFLSQWQWPRGYGHA
eukprot:4247107-Pyramimonas_sp.AAC.1